MTAIGVLFSLAPMIAVSANLVQIRMVAGVARSENLFLAGIHKKSLRHSCGAVFDTAHGLATQVTPSLITAFIRLKSFRTPMFDRGSPSTTIKSANLPGSIVPV